MVDVRYHWRLARYLLRQRASARYVFIHINKCGGTSVEAALRIPIKIHDSAQAHAAIAMAQGIFERVNLDLMYALPQQTLEQAEGDIARAISSGVSKRLAISSPALTCAVPSSACG